MLIDLKTDYAAGIEFHSVRVVLEDPRTGRPMTEMRAVTRSQDFIHGVRVAELGLGEPGTYAIETALLNTAGTVVASRRTSAAIQGMTVITVVIARGGEERCVGDSTCRADAPCVTGVCESGLCLMAPTAGACGDGEWCDIDAGECRPLPGDVIPTDGGGMTMEDGGMSMPDPDAGIAEDSGPGEVIPTAWRTTQMDLRDPHLYARAPTGLCSMCIDGTGEVNSRTQDNIDSLNRNLVFVALPFDPPGPNVGHVHRDARCSSASSCTPASEPPVVTTFTTTGDHIVTEPVDFTYDFDGVDVPMVEATLEADIVGDRLVNGVLRGFVTEAAARSARLPESGILCGEPLDLYDVLRGGGGCGSGDDRDDLDGDGDRDGWWLNVDLEAEMIDWTP